MISFGSVFLGLVFGHVPELPRPGAESFTGDFPKSCGISVVLNFEGDRAFVTHIPPRPAGERPRIDRWREVLRRERPGWCYLHAGQGVPAFLRDAREQGAKVVLDVSLGDERHRDTVIECVRLADVFVPNEEELLRLTGERTIGR